MTLRKAKLACFFVGLTLGVGCGPKSAADTEKDFNTTVDNAQKYASQYPAAKAVIDDLTKQAKADFDEAKKADEKSRADKMSVAADKLGRPLEVFKNYESEWIKLEALQHDKDLMAMSAADFNPLDQAASAAKKRACCILQPTEKVCSDLPGTCPTGVPPLANMGDLRAKLESAITDMQTAERALAARKPKPAPPAAPAAPAGSAAPAPAGSAAPPAAPAGSAAPKK